MQGATVDGREWGGHQSGLEGRREGVMVVDWKGKWIGKVSMGKMMVTRKGKCGRFGNGRCRKLRVGLKRKVQKNY